MFKALVFEISGGPPRAAHYRFLFENPAMDARLQTVQAAGGALWEHGEVTGNTDETRAFAEVLRNDRSSRIIGCDVLSERPGYVEFIMKWRRPRDATEGVSLDYMAHDIVGPDVLIFTHIAARRAVYKVAGPDGERLLRYYAEAERSLRTRFQVRLLRVGELSAAEQREPARARARLPADDRQLLAYALKAGYYDEPKRVGVRELGEALGLSKSALARRLRAIERLALESVVSAE